MNKIRYWKKQLYLANAIYDNCGKHLRDTLVTRLFNLSCEIGERIEYIQECDTL